MNIRLSSLWVFGVFPKNLPWAGVGPSPPSTHGGVPGPVPKTGLCCVFGLGSSVTFKSLALPWHGTSSSCRKTLQEHLVPEFPGRVPFHRSRHIHLDAWVLYSHTTQLGHGQPAAPARCASASPTQPPGTLISTPPQHPSSAWSYRSHHRRGFGRNSFDSPSKRGSQRSVT